MDHFINAGYHFTSLLVSLGLVFGSILLIKSGWMPKLMLVGSILGLIGGTCFSLNFILKMDTEFVIRILQCTEPIRLLGRLLFAIGFLFFALNHISAKKRAEELEAVLHEIHG